MDFPNQTQLLDDSGVSFTTTGLSRTDLKIQPNWINEDENKKTQIICNATCEIEVPLPGKGMKSVIEPSLLFGKPKSCFPQLVNPPAPPSTTDTTRAMVTHAARETEYVCDHFTNYYNEEGSDCKSVIDIDGLMHMDNNCVAALFEGTEVRVVRQNLVDRKGDIMIDIPANFQLGRGLRNEVERLHRDDNRLESYWTGQGKGNALAVQVDDQDGINRRMIFYMLCRNILYDEFDIEAYRQALSVVSAEAVERKIRHISTAKVPFQRKESGLEIRQAILDAFEGTGITIYLCVGRPTTPC